ncbi:MAG: prepilin-type N-terminal cleavage/methylation domain-containing protein [archaeon]
MRKKGFTVIELLIIIAIVGIIAAIAIPMYKMHVMKPRIITSALETMPLCRDVEPSSIKIKGRCIIIDADKRDFVSEYESLLKPNIRGAISNPELTIFAVSKGKEVQIGHYSVTKEPAFQSYVDIYVIYYPESVPVGKVSLPLWKPPEKKPVSLKLPKDSKDYVVPTGFVELWINNLTEPKVPKEQPAGEYEVLIKD